MECPAEGAGPVLADFSLLRPESEETSWKHAQHHQRWAAHSIATRIPPDPSSRDPRSRCSSRRLGGVPESSQNIRGTSIWGPKWRQNGSQMAPRKPLGASWPPKGLLELSWRPLGAVWVASWALLGWSWRSLGRPWACLGRSWGGLGGILRAQKLPKRNPEGSQIGSRRQSKLKT